MIQTTKYNALRTKFQLKQEKYKSKKYIDEIQKKTIDTMLWRPI